MRKNLNYFRSKLNQNQKICIVAKADCYALGSRVCKYFNDVDYFAVSSTYEFFRLKKYVVRPIIILDPIYNGYEIKRLAKSGCEFTISDKKSFFAVENVASKNNIKIKVHIALNTGMNRFGFSSLSEIDEISSLIVKNTNIELIGVFSHYFNAKDIKIAENQLLLFKKMCKIIEDKQQKIIKHICASDGVITKNAGDMVRIGYGLYSDKFFRTIELKTKIVGFQTVSQNNTAGYDGVFVAKNKTRVAVIGIGYGDGIMRNIVKKGKVLINGKWAKIVAVCMDSMIVNVEKIDCDVGDDVVIIGKSGKNSISICDIASWCDTIGYEILVRLSSRIKRKIEVRKYADNNRKI